LHKDSKIYRLTYASINCFIFGRHVGDQVNLNIFMVCVICQIKEQNKCKVPTSNLQALVDSCIDALEEPKGCWCFICFLDLDSYFLMITNKIYFYITIIIE